MAGKVPVRFLTSVSPYQAGEVAGFDDKMARVLVQERKVAVYYHEPGDTQEPQTAKQVKPRGKKAGAADG